MKSYTFSQNARGESSAKASETRAIAERLQSAARKKEFKGFLTLEKIAKLLEIELPEHRKQETLNKLRQTLNSAIRTYYLIKQINYQEGEPVESYGFSQEFLNLSALRNPAPHWRARRTAKTDRISSAVLTRLALGTADPRDHPRYAH